MRIIKSIYMTVSCIFITLIGSVALTGSVMTITAISSLTSLSLSTPAIASKADRQQKRYERKARRLSRKSYRREAREARKLKRAADRIYIPDRTHLGEWDPIENENDGRQGESGPGGNNTPQY